MRYYLAALSVATLVLLSGCNFLDLFKPKQEPKQPPAPNDASTPSVTQLTDYLNRNAAQIESIQVQNLDVEVKKGILPAFGLNGWMVCQKPRNFRMGATLPGMGSQAADLGSNDHEFWFWISKADPPDLYYCSYADVGRVQTQLPIQPEWVLEGMGMATVTPNNNMKVEVRRGSIDLIEATQTPQGQHVNKITSFNSRTVSGMQPQVTSRRLTDEKFHDICVATITQMQVDQRTGVLIPKEVKFEYPDQRMTMRLTLATVTVNGPIDPGQAQLWFTRPRLPNVRSIDLANFQTDPARPTNGIRPAGVFRGTLR
jgi:hypothetical protein